MIGRVKVVTNQGYGFIKIDTDEDIFFHFSQYRGNFKDLQLNSPPLVNEGPLVQFKLVETEKGPRALNVTLVIED